MTCTSVTGQGNGVETSSLRSANALRALRRRNLPRARPATRWSRACTLRGRLRMRGGVAAPDDPARLARLRRVRANDRFRTRPLSLCLPRVCRPSRSRGIRSGPASKVRSRTGALHAPQGTSGSPMAGDAAERRESTAGSNAIARAFATANTLACEGPPKRVARCRAEALRAQPKGGGGTSTWSSSHAADAKFADTWVFLRSLGMLLRSTDVKRSFCLMQAFEGRKLT
eukprot:scaffold5816_cov267-Pinguiococcus_pyrenoidosus.AAC.9